jgi:aromatic-L-amino-acid decarboxylase
VTFPPEEFRRAVRDVSDWVSDYLETVGTLPVCPSIEPGEIRDQLPSAPPELGEPIEDALTDFRDIIVPGLNHWNHPSFFGYFSVTASGPGILGEMLSAALNVNAMVWRSSPSATELEDVVTDRLRQLVRLPTGFEGVINDTASSSSL